MPVHPHPQASTDELAASEDRPRTDGGDEQHKKVGANSEWLAFDELANCLNSDIDVSLLNLDSGNSFDLSRTFGAVLKEECASPSSAESSPCQQQLEIPDQTIVNVQTTSESSSDLRSETVTGATTFEGMLANEQCKKFCNTLPWSFSGSERSPRADDGDTESTSWQATPGRHAPNLQGGACGTVTGLQPGGSMRPVSPGSCRPFHYVLGVPTAVGSKVGSDSMSYLNQSQSYEVRLKYVADEYVSEQRMVRTRVRLSFMDRCLQYKEKDEVLNWQAVHTRDRILDVDLPLSYGIFDVSTDPTYTNYVEFNWDSSREASIFLRINCISTEFTSKRHGGERGVSLRLYIETMTIGESPQRLDTAFCQIKVFKSKGADRKHKTDRQRFGKRQESEPAGYQPAYHYTVFADVEPEGLPRVRSNKRTVSSVSPNTDTCAQGACAQGTPDHASPQSPRSECSLGPTTPDPVYRQLGIVETPSYVATEPRDDGANAELLPDFDTPSNLQNWFKVNRFERIAAQFSEYKMSDIRCLSKSDLIQICGATDGIRLYNSANKPAARPVLCLFIAVDSSGLRDPSASLSEKPKTQSKAFHAIYLERFSFDEFVSKLCALIKLRPQTVSSVEMIGPGGIRIRVSDHVLENVSNESAYSCECVSGKS